MLTPIDSPAEEALTALAGRFEHWRQSRTPGAHAFPRVSEIRRSHSGDPERFREFGTILPWKQWPPLAGDVTHSHESQGFRLSGSFLMRLAQGLPCSVARKDSR